MVLRGQKLKPHYNFLSEHKGNFRGFGHLLCTADRSGQRTLPISCPQTYHCLLPQSTCSLPVFTPVFPDLEGKFILLPQRTGCCSYFFSLPLKKVGALEHCPVVSSYPFSHSECNSRKQGFIEHPPCPAVWVAHWSCRGCLGSSIAPPRGVSAPTSLSPGQCGFQVTSGILNTDGLKQYFPLFYIFNLSILKLYTPKLTEWPNGAH